jgi:hypothetical protein
VAGEGPFLDQPPAATQASHQGGMSQTSQDLVEMALGEGTAESNPQVLNSYEIAPGAIGESTLRAVSQRAA